RREPRRPVAPEAQAEIDGGELAVAPDGRGVIVEIIARGVGISDGEELADALLGARQTLAVAVAADLEAGALVEALRVDDRRVRARRQVERVATERAGVARDMLGPGSVTRLAADAELLRGAVEGLLLPAIAGPGLGVVAEDAVGVPQR